MCISQNIIHTYNIHTYLRYICTHQRKTTTRPAIEFNRRPRPPSLYHMYNVVSLPVLLCTVHFISWDVEIDMKNQCCLVFMNYHSVPSLLHRAAIPSVQSSQCHHRVSSSTTTTTSSGIMPSTYTISCAQAGRSFDKAPSCPLRNTS